MLRSAVPFSLFVLFGAASLVWCGAQQQDAEKPKADAKPAASLAQRLSQPSGLDKMDNVPLSDALELIGQNLGTPILADEKAFEANGVQQVTSMPVKLPKATSIRWRTVLRLVASQVQGTYLVRPDHIEFTTPQRAAAEVWGTVGQSEEFASRQRPLLPLVYSSFARRPLDEALQELSDQTGVNVLLDTSRAGEKAKAAVSARLANVPVDTAVRLLANQAELHVVLVDNALVVTTSDNAETLQTEQEKANRHGLDGALFVGGAPAGM
jgi:hypothetical protein